MTKGKIDLTPGVVMLIPSSSTPGMVHEIRLSKTGTVYCDCRGFRWRGFCSHVEKLIESNPAAKIVVKAGMREKIEHLQAVIKSLDE